jgi:hypothetical protein
LTETFGELRFYRQLFSFQEEFMADRTIYVNNGPLGITDIDSDNTRFAWDVHVTGGSINSGTFSGQTQYYNEATWDNARNNTIVAILASGSRTAGVNSTAQTNYNSLGAYILLDVTAVPSSGSQTLTTFVDIAQPDGTYTAIYQTAALTTIGLRKYLLYPGAIDDGSQLTGITRLPLPRTWRIRTLHSASGTFVYAISAYYVGS